MKNIVIDNKEFQVSPNKNLKTKLESQIEALKSQKEKIQKQLKAFQTKAKKANNLANCLETAEKFGTKFLTELAESEKEPNNLWWEHLISNKVKFSLKFEAGVEVFEKLILEKTKSQVKTCQEKLSSVQSQLQHQERKFARLQARRQNKTLLDCEYRKNLGCFGSYQCDNCQINYSVKEN